jgi:hypothetical protein
VRGRRKREAFSDVQRKQAREAYKPRRARAPPGPEQWAGSGKHGWPREREPLKRRCQADGFGRKAQERVTGGKLRVRRGVGVKALKGEAQECGELKEASEDEGAYAAERVAKP